MSVGLSNPADAGAERDRELVSDAWRQAEHAARQAAVQAQTVETPSGQAAPPAFSLPGYDILKEVHRGGQGVVYQAIQKSTKRKVAVKVMKEGPFAGQSDRARFEREVEILGKLKHPNIVTIYDSGTASGWHYFVMDYIEGVSLDEWMQRRMNEPPISIGGFGRRRGKPSPGAPGSIRGSRSAPNEFGGSEFGGSIDDTLKVFAKICDAVQAAHLKGIIHRDLKPGNVRMDTNGEPHVLDFGLAKIASPLSPHFQGGGWGVPAMTVTGQFLGSLPWASPEQAEGVPDRIDLRTDVYSLGVILYQMLTRRFPYEVVGNMRDVLDRIMKAEPIPPSVRHRFPTRHGESPAETGEPPSGQSPSSSKASFHFSSVASWLRRGVHPPWRVASPINDEIETIVLKCLQKDRERRYQTAGELARDIRHYLAGEPVEARRDSRAYVLRKFVRRNRILVGAAAAVVLFSILGAGIAAYGLVQASRQRDEAVAEVRQKGKALKFLKDMIAFANPYEAKNPNLTMREALDRASEKVKPELGDEPEVAVEIERSIALAYEQIGEQDREIAHHREALALTEQILEHRRRTLGNEHPDTLRAMMELANPYVAVDIGVDRIGLLEEALAGCRRVFGEEHPETLQAMFLLAGAGGTGHFTETLDLLKANIEARERVLGPEHEDTLYSMQKLSVLYRDQLRFEEAVVVGEELLEGCRRTHGQEHARTLWAMILLGGSYQSLGRFDSFVPLAEELLTMQRRMWGNDHQDTLASALGLAAAYNRLGREEDARRLATEFLDIWRLKIQREDTTAQELNDFASFLLNVEPTDLQDPATAVRLSERACALAEERKIVWLPFYLNMLAWAQHRTGDSQTAVQTLERALSLARGTWAVPSLEKSLAELEAEMARQTDESAPETPEDSQDAGTLPDNEVPDQAVLAPRDSAQAQMFQADMIGYANPFATVNPDRTLREILNQSSETIDAELGDEPEVEAVVRGAMGNTYRGLGDYEAAEAHLQRALTLRESERGSDDEETLSAVHDLAALYYDLQRNDEAMPLYQRAWSGRRRVLGEDHADTHESMRGVASVYACHGDFAAAAPLLERALAVRRRTLGNEDPLTLSSIWGLGAIYTAQGRFEEAESMYQEALEGQRKTLGEDHPDTLVTLNDLGLLYASRNHPEEGERLLVESLAGLRYLLGEEHHQTMSAKVRLASLYAAKERYADVEALCAELDEVSQRVYGEDNPFAAGILRMRAAIAEGSGNVDDAAALVEQALTITRSTLAPDHPDYLGTLHHFAHLCRKQGKLDDAASAFQEALAGSKPRVGPNHAITIGNQNGLAKVYMAMGRYNDAEPLLRDSVDWYHRHPASYPEDAAEFIALHGRCLIELGRVDEGNAALREARTLEEELSAPHKGDQEHSPSDDLVMQPIRP